jgi:radical SAM enzyme (TIGR01210 family)
MDIAFVDHIYDPLEKKRTKRWVQELPGAGCAHYKKTGGCTMCGFNQELDKYNFKGRLYPHWFFMLIFYFCYFLVRRQRPEALYIYNGGSFLNDQEIPRKTQLAILNFVRKHKKIHKVLLETRAEFVTEEKLTEYHEAIGDKKLEIALGLESADDKVRNQCLKKGLSKDTFERAVTLCQEYSFPAFTYVFLKPHCLDEKKAIEDAVSTIKYCFEVGVSEISLSCAFIQRDTLLEKLWRLGEYKPPTLWSIIEVVERTAEFGPVRIGMIDDTPAPLDLPKNCPLCTEAVRAAIEKYRQTNDSTIFERLACRCKPN